MESSGSTEPPVTTGTSTASASSVPDAKEEAKSRGTAKEGGVGRAGTVTRGEQLAGLAGKDLLLALDSGPLEGLSAMLHELNAAQQSFLGVVGEEQRRFETGPMSGLDPLRYTFDKIVRYRRKVVGLRKKMVNLRTRVKNLSNTSQTLVKKVETKERQARRERARRANPYAKSSQI